MSPNLSFNIINMKKILILLSLVIVLASCNTSKEPVINTNMDNTWTQVETPITDINMAETTDTWITSSDNQESTVKPVKEEPVKVEPKQVVNVVVPKPKPVVVTPPKVVTPKQKPVEVTPPPVVVTPPTPDPVVVTPPKTTITKAEVALHNKKSDCYTIIDGKVFDITSFFWKHPGWDGTIIWLCWVDWSSAFNRQHWSSEKAIMTKDRYFKANLGN